MVLRNCLCTHEGAASATLLKQEWFYFSVFMVCLLYRSFPQEAQKSLSFNSSCLTNFDRIKFSAFEQSVFLSMAFLLLLFQLHSL